MISNTFKEPNFSCKVKDYSHREYEWITFAESEGQLRERLEKEGYIVIRISPYDFSVWKTRASTAGFLAQEAHQRGEKPEFKRAVWSELRIHLFELFHGKCAYCESKVRHISPGDVEHYRPKRKVEEDPTHPGYYWLAYDTGNLLPCCESCNRSRAKANHFPVKNGVYAHKPEDIDQEDPLLLNPYDDKNPGEHLEFIAQQGDTFLGTVIGITEDGEKSVRIYDLNRPELVEKRRTEQMRVIQDLSCALIRGSFEKYGSLWNEIRSGIREYSTAALATAESWLKEVNLYASPSAKEVFEKIDGKK